MSSIYKEELIFFYLTERFNTSFILIDSNIYFYLNRKQIKIMLNKMKIVKRNRKNIDDLFNTNNDFSSIYRIYDFE